MLYKINSISLIIITFLYINNGISSKIGGRNLCLFLTVGIIFINLFRLIKRGFKRDLNTVYIYIILGISLITVSFIKMGILSSLVGFMAIYINAIYWVIIINNSKQEEIDKMIDMWIKANIIFSFANALLGIYQYFIDPSIWGLATHDIYSNENLLNSGKVVRRITGLLGSPQNFSLYTAIMTYLAYNFIHKKSIRYLVIAILFLAGLLSGSRAYSIFLISVIGVQIIRSLCKGININKFFKLLLGGILGVIIVSIVMFLGNSLGNETLQRVFTFFSDWPALQVFIRNLNDIQGMEWVIGKGLGYNERLVAVLLSRYYISVESFWLNLLLQGGLMLVISLTLTMCTAIFRSLKSTKPYIGYALVGISINMLTSPAFAGLAMSFISWPLILFGLKGLSKCN